MTDKNNVKIAIIGLGYVGLPLAVEFGKHNLTIGYDINAERITALTAGKDSTLEVSAEELALSTKLSFTDNPEQLEQANVYIVTVPTPIDEHKQPDLTPLIKASETVAPLLNAGDTVIYESTVYPGATEEVCSPILVKHSGLQLNKDFFIGYSPERINPGDKTHRLPDILKVTSGSTPEAADFIDQLYASIINAGTYKASSIRVAEAAKVIENTQRDVNIALVNELAKVFNKLDIDTHEVLEAAGTKWNFLPFQPGLVGGHCIGVDPYYLTHKAQSIGYQPEVILAGRRINDGMGAYIAQKVIKLLTQKRIHVAGSNVLVLGLTFKENCPDIRNSRVIDVIKEFQSYHANVDIYDPWVDSDQVEKTYQLNPLEKPEVNKYDAVILCVGHRQFVEGDPSWIRTLLKQNGILFDVKSVLPRKLVDARL